MTHQIMRSVLSISIPPEKKKQLEERAKKANKSVSAYVLDALEFEQNLISEDELVEMSKQADKDYRAGKTKILTSFTDLMK